MQGTRKEFLKAVGNLKPLFFFFFLDELCWCFRTNDAPGVSGTGLGMENLGLGLTNPSL